MNALETFGLSKRFGRVHAVRGLDLAVPKGSVFGILGPNGSGKTTALGMVLGAVRPDEGAFAWFGGLAPHRARVRIGAFLDSPAYYPSLSAEQNLAIVARIKQVEADRIGPALERAGLVDRRGSPVHTYSLGMRQRLALAAALLNDPDVLVLDEPGNGVDPQGIADLRQIVRAAAASGETTIVIASHVLDEIEKVCSHVAVMNDGTLLTCGPLDAVVAQSGHTRLEDAFLSLVHGRAPSS